MQLRLAALLLISAPLAACASSALTVEQAIRVPVRAASVNLARAESTVDVTADAQTYLDQKMHAAFHDGPNAFGDGNDVTIRYRFVTYQRGSRALRYIGAGILGGKAKVVVEAEFLSATGERIGLVRAEGEVAGGIAGGSHNSGIDKAVNEIRAYAQAHLRG